MGGQVRKACPSCDFVYWGNYSIGVGALVRRDNKFLLIRRAQNPGKGRWTNPGGYCEQWEQMHETIVREVIEETGITARTTGVVAIRDLPREIHNVYIVFAMEYVDGEPTADGVEVDQAGFYSVEEMDGLPVANLTRWLVNLALQGTSPGLVPDDAPVVPLEGYGLFRIPFSNR